MPGKKGRNGEVGGVDRRISYREAVNSSPSSCSTLRRVSELRDGALTPNPQTVESNNNKEEEAWEPKCSGAASEIVTVDQISAHFDDDDPNLNYYDLAIPPDDQCTIKRSPNYNSSITDPVINELHSRISSASLLAPRARGGSGVYDDVAVETPSNATSSRFYDSLTVDYPPNATSSQLYDAVSIEYPNSSAIYDEVAPPSDENGIYHILDGPTGRAYAPHSADTMTSEGSEGIYEPVDVLRDGDSYDEADGWWSSSEFEPIEASTQSQQTPSILKRATNKLFGKSKSRNLKGKSFIFDQDKHPPAELPECPDGLTEKQQKRRYVVASIVEIENSYVQSLILLVEAYKKPLLESSLLPADKVENIFYKLDEILDCHLMFRIALHDRIRNWDEHESLGDDFCGVCKTMVIDPYSDFVNNFMSATDLFKKTISEKSSFSDFMNTQMKVNKDQVGPHGQMIKVVQRFPQYILQIKDLIKHTPPDHDDYLKLNMALSKLENVAYLLNERKRTSEERLAARVILSKLSIKNSDSILLRQDDVQEVTYGTKGEPVYQKGRRLLLFNDMICVMKIDSNGADEKLKSKWMCPVRDIEYHESGSACKMASLATGNTGSVLIQTNGIPRPKSDSIVNESAVLVHRELDDLRHDHAVLAQIMSLTSSLRQDYQGLKPDLLQEQLKTVQTSIRLRDEQLQMFDSCSISLSYTRNGHRSRIMFDMATPAQKQDWVMDFRAVKLAQEPTNSQCWLPEVTKLNHPLVVKNINVDLAGANTQVSCASPIFITSTNGGIGLQYLWVCSSNEHHGQVTILSIHSNQPHIIESFPACDGTIDCCALIPSNVHSSLDHMWMSDSTNHIYVHGLRDGEWRSARRKFPVPAQVKDICCYGNHVFLALADGSVLKYAKRKGSSLYTEPSCKRLRDVQTPVNCLLPCEDNRILAACGNTLFVLSAVSDLIVRDTHVFKDLDLCIDKMVMLGCGIWFSCVGDPSLRLIHNETYKNISEVHIGSALSKLVLDGSVDASMVAITALTTSQGLIWVGTNTGHILTIPVPILEGIPQQSGKVSLSSLCHTSPVKFISTVKCSITFVPKALSEEELGEEMDLVPDTRLSATSGDSAESDTYDEVTSGRPLESLPAQSNRQLLFNKKSKVKGGLGGGLMKQSKGFAVSTPNLAPGNRLGVPNRLSVGMYDSLMRLDDLDDLTTTTDIVSSLVPTNQLPQERQFTKISAHRQAGTVKVTKASSISDLAPAPLRPLQHNKRGGIQSMWALNTTSSHSVSSQAISVDAESKARDEANDQAHLSINVELRAKFGSRLSARRNSQCVSVSSILSQVAEDEEYIDDDELSSHNESLELSYYATMDGSGSFTQSMEEDVEEPVENEEALVITNFLKASLIVSGGEGLIDLNQSNSKIEESTLIMWQQNQIWT